MFRRKIFHLHDTPNTHTIFNIFKIYKLCIVHFLTCKVMVSVSMYCTLSGEKSKDTKFAIDTRLYQPLKKKFFKLKVMYFLCISCGFLCHVYTINENVVSINFHTLDYVQGHESLIRDISLSQYLFATNCAVSIYYLNCDFHV